MFRIVRTKHESVENSDFVAPANLVKNGESYHAAIIIRYSGSMYEFHYPGPSSGIEFNSNIRDYHHTVTYTIHADEIPSFIAYCKNIRDRANPLYGYFYSGESYDLHGNHLSNNDLGERMTCVGFCLNVFKGFLEEDYLKYSDWDGSSNPVQNSAYLESFCKEHGFKVDEIAPFHRRITPREFLISGFFNELPIRKEWIDDKKDEVQRYFDSRTE
ncbi:MAG: hypothetical protein H6581_12555 [Bacteroidia bacterium]|nr:hypothetical protein [Bacteroidia bacterium]